MGCRCHASPAAPGLSSAQPRPRRRRAAARPAYAGPQAGTARASPRSPPSRWTPWPAPQPSWPPCPPARARSSRATSSPTLGPPPLTTSSSPSPAPPAAWSCVSAPRGPPCARTAVGAGPLRGMRCQPMAEAHARRPAPSAAAPRRERLLLLGGGPHLLPPSPHPARPESNHGAVRARRLRDLRGGWGNASASSLAGCADLFLRPVAAVVRAAGKAPWEQ